jgi:hypothetical protein
MKSVKKKKKTKSKKERKNNNSNNKEIEWIGGAVVNRPRTRQQQRKENS